MSFNDIQFRNAIIKLQFILFFNDYICKFYSVYYCIKWNCE